MGEERIGICFSISGKNVEIDGTVNEVISLRNALTDRINEKGYETTSRVNFYVDTQSQARIKGLEKQLMDIQNVLNGSPSQH